MKANLLIYFTDGSTKELDLGEKCLELDLHSGLRQSIAVNQTSQGGYKMMITKGLLDNKEWKTITLLRQ